MRTCTGVSEDVDETRVGGVCVHVCVHACWHGGQDSEAGGSGPTHSCWCHWPQR